MFGSKFAGFFGGGNLPKKNQPEEDKIDNVLLNTGEDKKQAKGYFKRLAGMEEERNYIQEIGREILYRVDYFSNHADMFYQFTEMSEETFRKYVEDIRIEIKEIMEHGRLQEINKIKMLDDWFVELEKLLDEHLLHPIDQQCQEMYDLLLRHVNKSRSFDKRSPEDFRVFLEEIRDNHRVAQSQLEEYSLGEVNISVKDSALTRLRKTHNLLKSLKGALNKQLSKIRESASKMQKEIDQSYHKLLKHADQSRIFADEEPEEFKRKLEKIKERCRAASSQIGKYLSGTDSNEDKKLQALKMLEKSLRYIREVEQSRISIFDIKSDIGNKTIEFQQIYKWLSEYADQSQSFANQEPQEFRDNLKRIRSDHKHACSCIEKYLSGKDRDEANHLRTLQKLENSFGEIKEIERHLDTFLLNKLNGKISQTYNKLLKYADQSPRFTIQQQQDFIENLKKMDKMRENSKYIINKCFTEKSTYEDKINAFRALEEVEMELNLSLANEINAKIMQICNRIDKYEEYTTSEERVQEEFKELLVNLENWRKDANAKLEPYILGNNISEEEKCGAFEILEECLEKTKAIEIDMRPFLKDPMIQKIDQSYAKLLQGENKFPIFTRQELQELNQAIADIKEYLLINNRNEKHDNDAYKSLNEDFDNLSKLERKMPLYLQLQVLHNNRIKITTSVEHHLNNTTRFDSEKKRRIRKLMEQNVATTNNKFEKVKRVLKENNSPMRIEYFVELYLNEYHRSIEILRKQASQLLGFDIGLPPPKSE
ncbi:MAG TPA: hypothetical protein VGL94_14315 [Ktedonobacteraceae bacterium]|jgi:hypothetical protein